MSDQHKHYCHFRITKLCHDVTHVVTVNIHSLSTKPLYMHVHVCTVYIRVQVDLGIPST